MNQIANQTEKVWQEEETKSKQADKQAKRTHSRVSLSDAQVNTFLVNMDELEKQVDLMFADRATTESFTVVNGKATITPENAFLAKQYEEKVKDTQKQIKTLQKRVKHAKGAEKTNLQARLNVLTDEYDLMTKGTYTMTYSSVDNNAELKETTLEHINFVKGFVLTKFKDYDSLTSKEQKMLDKIKVDFALGSIKYKGKSVSVDTLLHLPECSSLIGKILFKGESTKAELETTDGKKLSRVETAEMTDESDTELDTELDKDKSLETEEELITEHALDEDTEHEHDTEVEYAPSSEDEGGEDESHERTDEVKDDLETTDTEDIETVLTGEIPTGEETTTETETTLEEELPYDLDEYISSEMEDFDKLLEETLTESAGAEKVGETPISEETTTETETMLEEELPYDLDEYISSEMEDFDTLLDPYTYR